MAGPQANIRNFIAPLRGPGRSAPSLLEDLVLFDPRQQIKPGYHLLEDGARTFAQAQYIGLLLSEGSCFHDWRLKKRQSAPPTTDERPSPTSYWRAAAICQKCRTHLVVIVDYTSAWQEEPCPTWEHPLHHLARSTWRQDAAYRDLQKDGTHHSDELHVFECTSRKCSAIVTVWMSPPVLSEDAVHMLVDKELLAKRTDAAFDLKKGHTEGMKRPSPLDVLSDLRAYFRNAWKRDSHTEIALDNKRFVVRFGPDGVACRDVLVLLGFELKPEKSWVVPQPVPDDSLPLTEPHNTWLDNIEAELDVLIANRSEEERQSAQDNTKIDSAWLELSRVLSTQNYERDPASRTAKRSLVHRQRSFTVLGIPEDASDDLVIWAYQRQIMLEDDDPKQTAKLMTALEDIQRQRQGEKLIQQVAIERSIGRYGEQTIADAYRSLGLSPEGEISDEIIIGNFDARLSDAPTQEQEMRQCLAALGEYRKSKRLVDHARGTVTTYDDALNYFGLNHEHDDSFAVTMYTSKVNDSPTSLDMAQKALQLIAEHRNSAALKSFIAAGYQGNVGPTKMDAGEAFAALNIEDRTLDDEILYTIYEMRLDEDPQNQARFLLAIQTIAEEKNSQSLKTKLQMPAGQQPIQTPLSLTEPIGLDNIGNTCYLNSLLQSLFTIITIRKIVLNFDDYKQDIEADDMKEKRVGHRRVSVKEVRVAQNFVRQLAELFRQMISSPSRAIRPAQELARLTLETDTAKQEVRRRSTIDSQRRPTLGTINDRPVLGPLPQSALDTNAAQPLQSPELMDTAFTDLAGISTDDTVGTSLPPTKPRRPDNTNDNDTSSDKTLVSQNGSATSNSTTEEAQREDDTEMPDHKTEVTLVGEAKATSDVQDPIADSIDLNPQPTELSTTVSSEPPQQPEIVPPSQQQQIYKPPDGPPPVPPRPIPLSTLEEYARQQDVIEVLTHAIGQMSCAIRQTGTDTTGEQQDEVKDTLYGIEQKHISRTDPQPPQPFLVQYLPISNHPKDLYEALDNYCDPEQIGDKEAYVTFHKLPPVLCLGLQRAQQDHLGRPYKINDHVEIPNMVYLDRYMDALDDSVLVARRRQTWQHKSNLRRLKARIAELEPQGAPPVDEALTVALAVIQHLAEVGATEKIDGLSLATETVEKMSELSQLVHDERTDVKSRISVLEQQIKDSFTDAAFRKQEYKLHAAFFHRGTSGSGHYWIYMFDHVNEIWRKYNDDHVTQVNNLNEIFGNPTEDRNNPNWSAINPANPYFLIYVRTDTLRPDDPDNAAVETVRRNPILPPPPPPQVSNHNGHQQSDAAEDEGIDIRPLGTETPSNSDAHAHAQSSHHEYAGQPSQMSYLPPAAAEEQDQKRFRNIGDVMNQPHNRPGQPHTKQESWDEIQMRQAIERSMKETQGDKQGTWDDSENMAVSPNAW